MRARIHHHRRPSLGTAPSQTSEASAPRQWPPGWAEFDERPATEVDSRSPAGELAALLQRFRDDLDDAARACAESRQQGLRVLAELAVLAVELDKLLERQAAERDAEVPESVDRALGLLKDRMLAHVAACGLEVVRLDGAGARDVADVVDVECWRYDALHETPVVVQELEAAVRLDGAVLRRGRVVMGGQLDAHVPAAPALERQRQRHDGDHAAAVDAPGVPHARPAVREIVCPIAGCGAVNDIGAHACIGCLTPLAGFTRLSLHADVLFNRGLRAARAGDTARARECFAAVVLWHPQDIGTRNAHALACLDASDEDAARRAWEEVLARSPGDQFAARGLAALPRIP